MSAEDSGKNGEAAYWKKKHCVLYRTYWEQKYSQKASLSKLALSGSESSHDRDLSVAVDIVLT